MDGIAGRSDRPTRAGTRGSTITPSIRGSKSQIAPDIIADKFLDGLNLIAGVAEDTRIMKQEVNVDSKQTIQNFLKLVQLQYALNPPNKSAVSKLASDIAKSLDKDKESALRTLGSSIDNHKDKPEILHVIVENALQIMRDKYSVVLGDMEAANDGEDKETAKET